MRRLKVIANVLWLPKTFFFFGYRSKDHAIRRCIYWPAHSNVSVLELTTYADEPYWE